MKPPRSLMRLLHWGLPAAAVAYLGYLLLQSDPARLLEGLTPSVLVVAALSALIYGLAFHLLAAAWGLSLGSFAATAVDLRVAVRGYALANFAKYLPGNVFHYVGRQVVASRLGCSQLSAAQATAVEIAVHLAASALLLALLLPFSLAELGWVAAALPGWWAAWPLLLLPVAGAALWLYFRRRGSTPWPPVSLRLASTLLLLQLIFFTLATGIGAWLALTLLGAPASSLPAIAFAFLFSWLVAFVVPGAPGGLGLREACLAAALQPYGDLAEVLLLVALSRVVLIVGEGFFAGSAHLLAVKARPAARA